MAGFEPMASDVRRDRSAIVPQPLPNITIFKYYHSFGLNCKHDDGKRTKKYRNILPRFEELSLVWHV